MPASAQLAAFIGSAFGSVWTLELLLFLKAHPERSWHGRDLVAGLRASEAIVAQGLETLLAGALIVRDDDGGARYAPATEELRRQVDETQALYARKPDAVRRLIVLAPHSGVSAFADSFRLRRDE